MSKLKIFLGILLILIIIGFVVKNPLLQSVADFLIADETAEKSDALIVLGGEIKGERTKRAVELYNQGFAGTLIFSDGTDLSWRTKAVDEMIVLASELGIPDTAIKKETDSRSTYENAVYSKKLMLDNGFKSAIVVTTDWHSKRSKFIFDKVFAGSDIKLTYANAPDDRIDSLRDWWQDSEKQQIVLTEWAKFIIYWLKY
ncbi:YdcF family protein [Schinkia azotoformans]|uniref:YdcF family protein n=1 Tax=Schinkia azotoformans TaxID=1454 RepID=UPI002DB84614|nr:YdcF family protein [Schinkia azotoformans]MEC1718833.1 YdcF family protein [Schinkia azotoformans]MEC1757669.1 YdcF family protein [Schinkia azotoformans]MEC1770269.1 YdcF family protein [Schinkia azotoformans]MED4350994.1 YdcF family protein [Schinkia azotoformans]MED4365639.1 YdcF family protein [Schinkia azotoformans]